MKLKKVLGVALCSAMAVAVAFSATACSSGPGKNEVNNDIEFDEYGDPIFEDITLKVWSVIGAPDNDYLSLVNTSFNDYYRANGIQAEISSIETSLFYTQLANTINTDPDNAPDVIIYHSERLTYLVENNMLVSLDDCYSSINRTFNSGNYLSNVLSECYVNNTLYGIPLDVHSGLWYIRTDILEKNGLSSPTNMSEFETVCEKLMQLKNAGNLWIRSIDNGEWVLCDKSADFYPVEMSGNDNIESGWIPQTAVLQNGESLTTSNGEPAWNTSNGLKSVMTKIQNWYEGTTVTNLDGTTTVTGKYIGDDRNSESLWSNLGSGMAVFGCEGPWWAESRLNQYDSKLGKGSLSVMGLAQLYTEDTSDGNSNKDKVYGVGHCFSVTKTVTSATRRAAGVLYAQYMTENAIDYMAGGHLPACKTVLANPEYTKSAAYDRYLKYMGDPTNFVMLGNTPYFSEVYEGLKRVYIYTLSKNITGTVEEFITRSYNLSMSDIEAKRDL